MARIPPPSRVLKSQKGVAMLLALFAMMILTFIAVEVSYDTNVDYVVAAQKVNRIKAYYAAKSAVELSLLRVMLYKQAVAAFGEQLQGNTSMLDPIWSFPFMWPPVATENMTEVDKGMLQGAVKESLMEAQYAATITPEGGTIDINDLGSDVKALKTAMIKQVLKIFTTELENNRDFYEKHGGERFDELVNNIADYVDEDSESLNGGDESAPYRDFNEPDLTMPPNRPLRTVDELHQVGGMKDDFYRLLAPKVTVFGTKGINVNYAPKDVLKALDISMKDEIVDKVIERRSNPKIGGPFKDDKDFFAFIGGLGANTSAIEETKVPLLYDMEFNFRINATGLSANVKREITAVVYDYSNLAFRLADLLNKQDEANNPAPTPTATGSGPAPANTDAKKRKIQASKGRPTVVYWEEN